MLPVLLSAFACSGDDKRDTADSTLPADTQPDTDSGPTDTDSGDTAPAADTGIQPALEWYEGTTSLTTSTWTGEEAMVATTDDGETELCRLTNATLGSRMDETCVGCEFVFDVTMQAGSLSGDHCENMKMYAGQNDGDEWIYAFAHLYVYRGYEYSDVVLWGYQGADGLQWRPFADGELSDRGDSLIYRTATYPAYYYPL